MNRTTHTRRARSGAAIVAGALAASALPLAAGLPGAAAATSEALLYKVVQEGLTPDDGAQLADRAGIGNALLPDGSFAFVDAKRFGVIPSTIVGRGQDEKGRATVSRAINFTALRRMKTLDDAAALEKAGSLLSLPDFYGAKPTMGHTTVDQADERGQRIFSKSIDATVSFQLDLGGVPVVGPGAKLRVAFAGDGSVIQLGESLRKVAPSDVVPIISPDEAQRSCVGLYGPGVEQGTPTLAYYAPPLGADRANGVGSVAVLVPHYVCQPLNAPQDGSTLGGRLVPAAPQLSPMVDIKASGDGKMMSASALVHGGTAPYSFHWSSGSTRLDPADQTDSISYAMKRRFARAPEQLSLVVTDANGLSTTAAVQLPGGKGEAAANGLLGGSGGVFASTGIEQTVDEWQCAQDSGNGFRASMLSHGQTVKFDWRGWSAFEKDFKDVNLSGWDNNYVDSVDAQWYTGHGNPNGFTFKSSVDDTSIVPGDARWGDTFNLEWLQLESCQVLRDTNGMADYFGRWGGVFRGLHLLNGFDTNATCINGGTGGRFADYLFPYTFLWWTIRPALTVQQAWGTMASDLEPSGTRWRSVSPATTGWVTNLGDHFWGQGSTGPDIAPGSASNPLIGWVSVSGVA